MCAYLTDDTNNFKADSGYPCLPRLVANRLRHSAYGTVVERTRSVVVASLFDAYSEALVRIEVS